MKKILFISLAIIIVISSFICLPVSAANQQTNTTTTIQYLDNGDYIETTITYYESNLRVATKSGSKTASYKDGNGNTMWTVTVHGTFNYNGTTSSCTSVSRSTTAPGANWSIKSSSCSKSGYCATATATATHKASLISKDYTMTVNLYCSPYGILS